MPELTARPAVIPTRRLEGSLLDTAGWNLLYTNSNPNPATICADCRQFIGFVFDPDEAPKLPMHAHCYCSYKPVYQPPTWPDTDAPYETWDEYFDHLQSADPAAYRRWVQRAAWYLRIGWPLGIMTTLKQAAERYNDEEYKKDPEQKESPMTEPIPEHTPTAPQPPAEADPTQDRGNHPSSPPSAAQDASQTVASGAVRLEGVSPDWRAYEAVLVSAGRIRQDDGQESSWLIPGRVLDEAVAQGLFKGLPHYVDHPDKFGFGWRQSPSVRDLAGIVSEAYYDDDAQAIVGTIRLYNTEAGHLLGTLYDHIIADAEAGRDVPPLGLSIAAFRDYELDEQSGLKVWTHIKKVSSVDAVYEPGAAGYITQALSAVPSQDPNAPVRRSMQPPLPSDHSPLQDPNASADPPVQNPNAFLGQEMQPHLSAEARRLSQRIENALAAGYTLDAEDLDRLIHPLTPDPYEETTATYPTGGTMTEEISNLDPATHVPPQEVISPAAPVDLAASPADPPAAFDPNRIQENLDTLNTAISRIHALLARNEEPNTIQSMGDPPRGPHFYGGLSGIDQVQLAVEAMIAGTRPPSGVRPLTGIRELYMLLSGDYELTGRFHDDRVYLANVTTSTMAGIVANALNKVVINMFQEYDQWWAPAVSIRDFASLQDVRWITLGGVGELPTVAEGAAYTEMSWDDQTETDAFVKKGGYLGITLETIDKDDTGRVMAAPRALAQAAWLTLGKSIAEVFTANSGTGPAMSDSNYIFDASNHDNYGSTALSFAAWQATQILMMKYTEVNSSERLGALTRPRLLWVPIDLENTAVEILAAGEGEPDDADYHVNPDALADGLTARTAAARRRVITCPFWTDTNNWVAQADPTMYPGLGLAFRYGRTPEIFSVADPRAGLMFTNDTMPVKVRFFYAVGPTDYRAFYKHNVT